MAAATIGDGVARERQQDQAHAQRVVRDEAREDLRRTQRVAAREPEVRERRAAREDRTRSPERDAHDEQQPEAQHAPALGLALAPFLRPLLLLLALLLRPALPARARRFAGTLGA